MKETSILNAQLVGYIVRLRHKKRFLIGDTRIPVPRRIPVVDLVLCGETPAFQQIIGTVLDETVVKGYIFVAGTREKNPVMMAYARGRPLGIPEQTVPYDKLKRQTENIKFAVRTGESTPYSNLILQADVMFPD